MKRFLYISLVFFLCTLLCSCSKLNSYLKQSIIPESTVYIVGSQALPEFRDLDPKQLALTESDFAYQYAFEEDPANQFKMIEAAAKAPSTAVLVAELRSTVYASAMIECAEKAGLPLIFCGAKPADAIMERYENCWFVGFEPLLAAELQAKLVTDAFRAGELLEQSGDYKFSGLLLAGRSGIYSHDVSYRSTLKNGIELAGIRMVEAASPVFEENTELLLGAAGQLLLPQENIADEGTAVESPCLPPLAQTEIFMSADLTGSHAVLALLEQLAAAAADESLAGCATPPRRYYVCAYGIDETVAAAVSDGTFLGAVGKDSAASTAAVVTLCENLARKEAITRNNEYYFENGKYLMLDYLVLCADTEE